MLCYVHSRQVCRTEVGSFERHSRLCHLKTPPSTAQQLPRPDRGLRRTRAVAAPPTPASLDLDQAALTLAEEEGIACGFFGVFPLSAHHAISHLQLRSSGFAHVRLHQEYKESTWASHWCVELHGESQSTFACTSTCSVEQAVLEPDSVSHSVHTSISGWLSWR